MALLITCVEPDSDAIAAVIGHAHISIPNAALLRSSVLRTVAGDVQDGEHVPIPAEETGFQEWLKTVNAVNDVQCQALLSSLGTDAVVQIVQVADGLGDGVGIAAGCHDICARLFPTTLQRRLRATELPDPNPGKILDVLPAGIQMRIMRAAPSLQTLLVTLPRHLHSSALCAKIRTIDAAGALQVPHNWTDAAVWASGAAAVGTLTHLTRLSAAFGAAGSPESRASAAARLEHLLGSLSTLRKLRSLTLCGLCASDVHMTRLAECLPLLPGLTNLRVSGTAPGSGSFQMVLEPCTALRQLSLARLTLTDDLVGELAAALPSMPALSALDLSHTGFTHAMCAQLWEVLPRMLDLRSLNLSFNQLGGRHMKEWNTGAAEERGDGAPVAARMHGLHVIDLAGNSLTPAGNAACDRLGALPFVHGQTALTRLELTYTSALSTCVRAAHVAALRTLSCLRCLRVQQCGLGVAGAEALAQTLPVLQALTQLDLPFNAVGNDGAAACAAALRELQQLQVLSLAANEIGDFGAEALAEATAALPRLRRLSLMANGIGDQGAGAVRRALPEMRCLRQLILAANPISAKCQADVEGACERQGVCVLAGRGTL